MPEYIYDEKFEHRLEQVLREIGDEAVVPFDPSETTQLVISNSRIGGVPVTSIPAAQMAQQAALQAEQPTMPIAVVPPPPPMAPPMIPPPAPPPGYYDEPLPGESRRWPLLTAIGLLIAALVFAGFATGFIKLPTNFGFTIGSPAPPAPTQTTQTTQSTTATTPVVNSGATAEPTPKKTRKPRRTPRPRRTDAPTVTAEPQPTAAPTEAPTPEPLEPTPEPPATDDASAPPI